MGNTQKAVNVAFTITTLIFTVLIFHKFTNWTLFAILFLRINIDMRPGNSYYLEYSRLAIFSRIANFFMKFVKILSHEN